MVGGLGLLGVERISWDQRPSCGPQDGQVSDMATLTQPLLHPSYQRLPRPELQLDSARHHPALPLDAAMQPGIHADIYKLIGETLASGWSWVLIREADAH